VVDSSCPSEKHRLRLRNLAGDGCAVMLGAAGWTSLLGLFVRGSRGLRGRRLLSPMENGLELLFDFFFHVGGSKCRGVTNAGES